ncbi:L-lactate transporter [subsurface metagenome]
MLRNRQTFYGWRIVAVSFLVLFVHAGAAFYSFGVLRDVLEDELEASSAAISGVVSIYMVVLGLTAPLAGKLTDKYGPKNVIVVGGVIGGAALLLCSLSTAVWHLYLLYFVIGIGMSGAGFVPITVALSNWFTRRRGMAIGIATVGVALGAIALAPLTNFVIESASWRASYVVLGVITLICCVLPVMLVMKTRPQDMGLLPDGEQPVAVAESATVPAEESAGAGEPGWTTSTAIRTLPYWLTLVAFFFVGMAIAGVLQHEKKFFEDVGIAAATASLALGFTGGIGGVGKVTFGYLADRISPKRTALVCFALQIVGLVLLLNTESAAMMWVSVAVFGFAMGGNIALQPLIIGDFFGLASFGTIFGSIVLAAAVGSALGPVLAGAMYDALDSYNVVFTIFIIGYAVALAALVLARRPEPKTRAP